jgi:hypothetical protein
MSFARSAGQHVVGPDRLSFLDHPLPAGFRRCVVAIEPGRERPYLEREWRGALVVVERGALELETLDGERMRLCGGAVLWLAGLRLRALHAGGAETVLLAVISRVDEPPIGLQ